MFKSLYLSHLGLIISLVLNIFGSLKRPFMVYGHYCSTTKKYLKYTRISTSSIILDKRKLVINNYCWIGHHCIIDASGGLTLGEGVQISSLNSILTHSSHISIRLLGRSFLDSNSSERQGYLKSPVSIGDYSFIGSGAIILPGTNIGRGCVIGAGSVVKGEIPDFSVVIGNPAKIVGSTGVMDKEHLSTKEIVNTYFDKQQYQNIRNNDF